MMQVRERRWRQVGKPVTSAPAVLARRPGGERVRATTSVRGGAAPGLSRHGPRCTGEGGGARVGDTEAGASGVQQDGGGFRDRRGVQRLPGDGGGADRQLGARSGGVRDQRAHSREREREAAARLAEEERERRARLQALTEADNEEAARRRREEERDRIRHWRELVNEEAEGADGDAAGIEDATASETGKRRRAQGGTSIRVRRARPLTVTRCFEQAPVSGVGLVEREREPAGFYRAGRAIAPRRKTGSLPSETTGVC
eukprot:ctg_225.g93